MGDLDAAQALDRYDITEDAHAVVLENASQGRPWTPEVVSQPGVRIEEGTYVEGILRSDPRESQDRHDLLVDGRLDRYAENIDRGSNKWDLVLTERDFHENPGDMSASEHETLMGDADLLFLDLDRYEAHMVEVKPHEGYTDVKNRGEFSDPDPAEWSEIEEEYPAEARFFIEEEEMEEHQLLDAEPERRGFDQSNAQDTADNRGGGSLVKKTSSWRKAWQSVVDELGNDWSVYEPEFVFGSEVLDVERLSSNPEYALPPQYSQDPGYILGSDEGIRKAENSDDLEVLNEFFFRDDISELIEGERPEMEGEKVF
ncbi:hypothetical protein GKQ38_04135 [Candidatus Nanohaloarchaea archaeon]|nr:hypothetical protein GKQ38_04135 [Candidatus Nanohaloarchaea archaeon]